MKSDRPKYTTRKQLIRTEADRELFIRAVRNAPLDSIRPLQGALGEEQKGRGMDANARMWAGPLADLEKQGWVAGRQFSAEVWHEHLKREYLPAGDEADITELVKHPENYRKWDCTPSGERVCVGSTTDLTVRGFALYMHQIEAFAASIGVKLSESPKRYDERMAA